MSPSSLRAILFGLAAFASTSSAVTLGNFKPFLDNLSPSCTTVYNSQIAGCTSNDFTDGPCSSACMAGLAQTQAAVLKNCSKDDVSETSIIGVFQANIGVQALCPKNTASSTTSTTTAAKGTITMAAPATQTTSSLQTMTSSLASSTSSGGLVLDPTPLSTFSTSVVDQPTATTVQPSSSTRKPKATGKGSNGQLSNSSSGGGSPFDVQSTNISSQVRVTSANIAILLATMSLLASWS